MRLAIRARTAHIPAMINTPTVLILGAGASAPYGFPLGRGLRDLVCGISAPTVTVVAAAAGHDEGQVEEFVTTLRHSGYTSVDWFLEDRTEFISVGKAAIAAALIPLELPERLFPPHAPGGHWYELLLNTLETPQGAFAENQLSIITFNYDRSLEHYLLRVLETRRRSERHAIEALRSIEIIHVHGALGQLPPLARGGREYSPTLNRETACAAAEQIYVVGEVSGDTEAFNRARAVLGQAQKIDFLGFGYHPESVRRLGVFNEPWDDDRRKTVRVVGTSQGIPRPAWQRIEQDVLHNAIPPGYRDTNDVFIHLNEVEPLDA